jgi:hypothetical protein
MSIPLYTFDFALIDFIGRRHALRLERDGIAKVVRHKKGTINRVVLRRRACDPRRPTTVRDYQGKAIPSNSISTTATSAGSFGPCRAAAPTRRWHP